jgi:hypothetical protein
MLEILLTALQLLRPSITHSEISRQVVKFDLIVRVYESEDEILEVLRFQLEACSGRRGQLR